MHQITSETRWRSSTRATSTPATTTFSPRSCSNSWIACRAQRSSKTLDRAPSVSRNVTRSPRDVGPAPLLELCHGAYPNDHMAANVDGEPRHDHRYARSYAFFSEAATAMQEMAATWRPVPLPTKAATGGPRASVDPHGGSGSNAHGTPRIAPKEGVLMATVRLRDGPQVLTSLPGDDALRRSRLGKAILDEKRTKEHVRAAAAHHLLRHGWHLLRRRQ